MPVVWLELPQTLLELITSFLEPPGHGRFAQASSACSAAAVSSRRGVALVELHRRLQLHSHEPVSVGDAICGIVQDVTLQADDAVRRNAFLDCRSLRSVTLPEGLREICDSAFCGCSSLANVSLPSSVNRFGDKAFMNCTSLTSIDLPAELRFEPRYIGTDDGTDILDFNNPSQIFAGCTSLTTVTFTDDPFCVPDHMFDGCISLVSLALPEDTKMIYQAAFRGCSSLTSIRIPNSVAIISKDAFRGCSSLTSVVFPSAGHKPHLGLAAFYSCPSLDAPSREAIRAINANAFTSSFPAAFM